MTESELENLSSGNNSRYLGALLGLAIGDAIGTTVEFSARGSFTPLKDMTGGGPFQLAAGQWTDDTSMALCLAHSLVHCNGFDAVDQMNRYCNWYQYGYMSSTGVCFDIGHTTAAALQSFLRTQNPWSGSADPRTAGNGGIMRLAPVPMFYAGRMDLVVRYSAMSSRTTHAAPEAVECAMLFGSQLATALQGGTKNQIFAIQAFEPACEKVMDILNQGFVHKSSENIVGSGYVIRSLEAALWCFYHSESYSEAVLMAANLGDDADTTAAITGQLAGAYYGVENIPQHWLNRLMMRNEISELALLLARGGMANL